MQISYAFAPWTDLSRTKFSLNLIPILFRGQSQRDLRKRFKKSLAGPREYCEIFVDLDRIKQKTTPLDKLQKLSYSLSGIFRASFSNRTTLFSRLGSIYRTQSEVSAPTIQLCT